MIKMKVNATVMRSYKKHDKANGTNYASFMEVQKDMVTSLDDGLRLAKVYRRLLKILGDEQGVDCER